MKYSVITKKDISTIKKFIINILRKCGKNRDSLKKLSKDNCSELARLTGCFILKSFKKFRQGKEVSGSRLRKTLV
ncbi:MAG: hypothetical protein PHZ25_03470 [Candidatus Pacebacteria bacterium]|nr:hypothetical protein [Candidatus Paceibacterota bacterium]